jgi:hypothetical protein
MEEKEKLEALYNEFDEAQEELQDILMDIRTYLMEAQSPIPNDLDRERLREELESEGR